MNGLGATIDKKQPFWFLWHSFLHLEPKLGHFESNSIVARGLIPSYVLCRISKPKFITICSTTFVMQLLILYPLTKIKILTICCFFLFLFLHTLYALVFSKNEVNNLWIYFCHLITHMFCLWFWQNFYLYFYSVYPDLKLV